MPPSDPRGTGLGSALQRLMEAQNRPASPGFSPADVSRLLELAAAEEEALARAPMQNAMADAGPVIQVPDGPDPELTRMVQESRAPDDVVDIEGVYRRAGEISEQNPEPPPPSPEAEAADRIASGDFSAAQTPAEPSPYVTSSHTAPGPTLRDRAVVDENSYEGARPVPQGEPGSMRGPRGSVGQARWGTSGELIVPLEGGTFVIPPENAQTAEDITAYIRQRFSGYTGETILGGDPNSQIISPQQGHDIVTSIAAIPQGGGQMAQGPQGPLTTTRTSFERTVGGPVDPALIQRAEELDAQVRAAQEEYNRANVQHSRTLETGMGMQSEMQQMMAEEQARLNEEYNSRLRNRMSQVDAAIEKVKSNTIDPNRYFGRGAGGRIGAAIAVALGSIGSALTGGPNSAMAIIDAAINRDLQAQQADMENARAGANMQQQAFHQFRSIIGDEAGAAAATRAAHYQAFLTRLNSQVQGATGDRLEALQTLQGLVQERLANAQAIAAKSAEQTTKVEVETEHRSRGGATAMDAAEASAESIASGFQGAQQPQPAPQTAAERVQAEIERIQPGEGEIEVAPGVAAPAAEVRPRTPQQRMTEEAARRRLERNPNDREAREIVAAADRERRRRTRRRERAIHRRLPTLDREVLAEAQATFRTDQRRGDTTGVAVSERDVPSPATLIPGRYDQFVLAMQDPEARGRLNQRMSFFQAVNRLYAQVQADIGEALESGVELTSSDPMIARIRAASDTIREIVGRYRSGAAITEAEDARYEELMPALARFNLQNLTGAMQDQRQRWAGFYNAFVEEMSGFLDGGYGLTLDNMRANRGRRQRAVQAADDLARQSGGN